MLQPNSLKSWKPERVIETELVLRFDFELAEGRTVRDLSRHGNDGRLDPGLELRMDGGAGALVCDGRNMLEVRSSGSLDPAHVPFVVELQARAEARDGVLIARGGRSHGWALVLRDGRPAFVVNAAGQRSEAIADHELDAGWHHLAGLLARDGQARVYVDGRLAGVSAGRRMIPGEPAGSMQICNERGSRVSLPDGAPGFRGSIGELRIHRGEVAEEVLRKNAEAARVARSESEAMH